MDFDLSEEQSLLKDSVEKLILQNYDFEQRKKYLKLPEGFSPDLWARYAEMGLLGLPFAEADGGFGGGAVETMIVMEAFGRGLVLEPYFATVVLAGGLLRHAASPAQRAELIPAIAAGTLRLAFAHAERQARYDLADVTTAARESAGAWRVSGEKSLVLAGEHADRLIVSARVSGAQRAHDGIGLFLVDAKAPGVSRRGYALQDATRAAEISLSDTQAIPLGVPGEAFPVIARVVDEAIAALCAEAVGVMAAMHEVTLDYLRTRKQFGRAIGQFQVLQHRAVDMLVAIEQARSMAMFATMMAAEADATDRRRAMAAAKIQIGRSGHKVGQEAIQLHGGIGMTMEYKVGHYFKRMTMIELLFGDADHHLAELAAMGGLIGG
ncbi:MAG: acyl-CoA dehydrogenase family protein [Acidibrevibacterium sp.]|uniref:acyl-CoA dehydrogenase family protein n=1 Tax=Acidibrevibacterium sp. TaxID=2606776 RepID=UPI003D092F0B